MKTYNRKYLQFRNQYLFDNNICMGKSFLALFALLLVIVLANCQFNESRLRIIDQNEGHYLVRGNLPMKNFTFDFETLYKKLSQFTNTTGYRIVVISLLNAFTPKETKNKYIQENYFGENGQFRYNQIWHIYQSHPILGVMTNPAQYPAFLRKIALRLYDYTTYDNIPTLLDSIDLRMKSPRPTIIYVHCSQGVDRAGYVAGAYKMKNKGISLRQVMRENFQAMKGFRHHMHFNSFNGLQWYCLYLGRSEQECQINNPKLNKASFFIKTPNDPETEEKVSSTGNKKQL